MIKQLLHRPTLTQFIKFSVVGCLNVAVSSIVFYISYTKWHMDISLIGFDDSSGSHLTSGKSEISNIHGALSSIIAYIAGMITSFILNKSWTFKVHGGTLSQARRFVFINLIGLTLLTVVIFIFVDLLNYPYMVVWFIAISFVLALNFIGYKYWTFINDEKNK